LEGPGRHALSEMTLGQRWAGEANGGKATSRGPRPGYGTTSSRISDVEGTS